jgi:hypothetical protein
MKCDEEGYRLCQVLPSRIETHRLITREFLTTASPSVLGIRFIVCRIFINGWIVTRSCHTGRHTFTAWEKRRDKAGAGMEQKVWEERPLILQLGFHDDGSYSLSLGRPDLCELETETIASHPPHHGPVNTHWPLLVVKKQG